MSTPRYGEFNATIQSILINISQNKPFVSTRIALPKNQETDPVEYVSHTIRLDNPDSQRIGFDELRSAFPQVLGAMSDEELLIRLMTNTDEFNNATVRVAIEPQMKNNVQVRGPDGRPYFNVRLRSGVRNLGAHVATTLARQLLNHAASKRVIDGAFDDAAHN